MDDSQIKTLVTRLSRPHPSGGVVIERAALLAAGSDFPQVMAWITAHEGLPETTATAPPRRGGLHSARLNTRDAGNPSPPARFVLPAGVAE
jgi:hypothetical protein